MQQIWFCCTKILYLPSISFYMIICEINIKKHLAQYFTQKYWNEDLNFTVFSRSFVLVKILNSLVTKPQNAKCLSYNFVFGIIVSKELEPYLSKKKYIPDFKVRGGTQKPGIEKILEDEFYMDIMDYWNSHKLYFNSFSESITEFCETYNLDVKSGSILKHFKRLEARKKMFKSKNKNIKKRKELMKKFSTGHP